MLTRLGNRLADNGAPVHAQTLLESVAADGPVARALEDFFTANKLAIPSDRDERRAAARRKSRIDAVPDPLRSAVAGFAEHLVLLVVVGAAGAPAPTPADTPRSRRA